MPNICILQTGTWIEIPGSVNTINIYNSAGQNSQSLPVFLTSTKNKNLWEPIKLSDSDTANWVRHAAHSAFQKHCTLQRFPKLLPLSSCWYRGLCGTISSSTDPHTSQNPAKHIPSKTPVLPVPLPHTPPAQPLSNNNCPTNTHNDKSTMQTAHSLLYSYALMYNKKSRFHFFLKNFWPHLPLSTWITKLRAMSLYYYFKSTLNTLSCPTVTRMPTQQQSPVWN